MGGEREKEREYTLIKDEMSIFIGMVKKTSHIPYVLSLSMSRQQAANQVALLNLNLSQARFRSSFFLLLSFFCDFVFRFIFRRDRDLRDTPHHHRLGLLDRWLPRYELAGKHDNILLLIIILFCTMGLR